MAASEAEQKALARNQTHVVLKGGFLDDGVIDIEDLYGMSTAKQCKDCDAKESKMYYFPFRKRLQKESIYEYCRCGRSGDFPFCDHSHTVQDVKNKKGPIKIKMIKDQGVHMLCGCRLSKGLPFCDGSHAFVSYSNKSGRIKPQNKL